MIKGALFTTNQQLHKDLIDCGIENSNIHL